MKWRDKIYEKPDINDSHYLVIPLQKFCCFGGSQLGNWTLESKHGRVKEETKRGHKDCKKLG